MKDFGVIVEKARVATNKKDGKEFVALDLIQVQPVMSKGSKKEYLGKVKASVTTALSLEIAQSLEGQDIGGRILRKPLAKPLDYTTKDGRKVKITYETEWVSE